ncbi:hypothetical protein [Aurantibacter sp.]|uniref:hypothetical protein n=1 Tax=Aurantibacter sp. TaxID=2807103 RepID=UPI0035C8309A
MKQFFNRICLFITLPVLILIVLVSLHNTTPLMSDYDYDGGFRLKQQLLKKNKDKAKIILIGGSNLSMGLNSGLIKSSFPNYQIINFGHRFQYGLDFYISQIKPYLNKNDIVVIVPEYQLILDDYFGNHALAKVKLEKLNYAHFEINLSPRDVLAYINQRIRFLYKLKKGSFPNKENHNRASAFNEFGDCNVHWFWGNKKYSKYKEPLMIKPIDSKHLKNFVEDFKKKGVDFVLIPPMYEKNNLNSCKNLVKANVEFYKKSGLTYAYPMDKMTLDSDYFYDSPYHLLHKGIEIKTNKIINIVMNEIKVLR